MAIAVGTFLTTALAEIRVAKAGDTLDPETADLALTLFNELLEAWNAEGRAVYARGFATFTLTPNLQPHTIGLAANTPTFSVSVGRPGTIRNANLILANNIRVKLDLLDDDEWDAIHAGAAAGQAVTITSSVPRQLNYRTDWPNGSIYLWPVPSTAYGLELETDTPLAQVLATDTLDLPPGYQQALRLSLAELAASAFGQTASATTVKNAETARQRIFAMNDEIPNADTVDAGMPGGTRGGGFSFRTGNVE